MVICSAEQSHEWMGQLPHPDRSGSSFLQSSCHGRGDGWALHRQRAIAKTKCIPRGYTFWSPRRFTLVTPKDYFFCIPRDTLFSRAKSVSSIGIQNVH